MARRSRTLLLVAPTAAVVALLASGAGIPAYAEQGEAGATVLVLDSSGSMANPATGGRTRMEAARAALVDVVDALPDGRAVGLRVYGARVFSRADRGACRDSQLVVPVETGNRDALRAALDRTRPHGVTPTAHALHEAGEDLGATGSRAIVLVSDGESSCAPDPCKVARRLMGQGSGLRIDVVGLDVDGEARRQLRCIASAGHGSYVDADSAAALATLTASLEALDTRPGRPYDAVGRPVTGTPRAAGAPTIGAGDWLDTLGADGTAAGVRTYLVERALAGSTVHVSASIRSADRWDDRLDLHLATVSGLPCGRADDPTQIGTGQLVSASRSAGSLDGFGNHAPRGPCATADTLVATVGRDDYDGPDKTALELRVVEEPAVQDVGSLAEGEAYVDLAWVEPPTGPATEATGRASFADSSVLAPGVYEDTIVPGEVLTYPVRVGWGQQLSALVHVPKAGAALQQAVGRQQMITAVQIFGPTRAVVSAAGDGGPARQRWMRDGLRVGVTAAPVAYRNRGRAAPIAGASVAGVYTVAVFLEADPDRGSYAVPFTVSLGVAGAPQAGPAYADAGEAVDPGETATARPTTGSAEPVAKPREESVGKSQAGSGVERVVEPAPGGSQSLGLLVGGLGLLALVYAGFSAFHRRDRRE